MMLSKRKWYKVYGIDKEDPEEKRILLGIVKAATLAHFLNTQIPKHYQVEVYK